MCARKLKYLTICSKSFDFLRENMSKCYSFIYIVCFAIKGHMYVPMETNPANSKAGSRENTDYDTFGSIDSLIFEPKIPTQVREYITFLSERIWKSLCFKEIT